jgi:hypothetical protein
MAAVQARQSIEQQCATLERLYQATRQLLLSKGDGNVTRDGETDADDQGAEGSPAAEGGAAAEDEVFEAARAVEQRHRELAAPLARRGSKYCPHVSSRPELVAIPKALS